MVNYVYNKPSFQTLFQNRVKGLTQYISGITASFKQGSICIFLDTNRMYITKKIPVMPGFEY